jgi:hypothetical protein
MNKVNLAEIAAIESESPKGRYHRIRADISSALTAKSERLDNRLPLCFVRCVHCEESYLSCIIGPPSRFGSSLPCSVLSGATIRGGGRSPAETARQ